MKTKIKKAVKGLIHSMLFIVLGLAIGRGAVLGYNHLTQVPLVEHGNHGKYYTSKLPNVVLFGASWCQFCKKTRSLLDSENIGFIDYDVEKNDKAMSLFKELDGKGYPLLLIGDTRINGFNKQAIIAALNQQEIKTK